MLLAETDRFSNWLKQRNGVCLVAGPCSVESEEQIVGTAQELARRGATLLRGGIWKPRTSPGCFEGVGEKGLSWLKTAGDAAGLPVATEVATPTHVERCLAAGIDVLWVGARTTTSPIAVQEIAGALAGVDIPVMIKNPMNPELKLWSGAIERFLRAGVARIVAVHRGFSTHIHHRYRYRPLWNIPLALRRKMPEIPILCDPSHISGECRFVPEVADKAMELGFDGLMVECHWRPDLALSDREQQLSPLQFTALAEAANHILRQNASGYNRSSLGRCEEIQEIDQDIQSLLSRRASLLRQAGEKTHEISPRDWIAVHTARVLAALLARLGRTTTPGPRATSSGCKHMETSEEDPAQLVTSS